MKVAGIILCGGHSRRMGAAKEWLNLGGETLLARTVRILSEAADPIVVAHRTGQDLPPFPATVLRAMDRIADAGPLEGIAAAFEPLDDQVNAALVVACDHPFLRAEFLTRLIALKGEFTAVVPRHGGSLHPLCALYAAQLRETIANLLAAGERRAQAIAEFCNARIVTQVDFADVDPDMESLRNVNTQADWSALRQSRPGN